MKIKNNKNNNGSTELSSQTLNIQYIKGAYNVLAGCLSRLVDANLTDSDYEFKGQEFGCTLFEDLPPAETKEAVLQPDFTYITSIHVLENHCMTELQEMSIIQDNMTTYHIH